MSVVSLDPCALVSALRFPVPVSAPHMPPLRLDGESGRRGEDIRACIHKGEGDEQRGCGREKSEKGQRRGRANTERGVAEGCCCCGCCMQEPARVTVSSHSPHLLHASPVLVCRVIACVLASATPCCTNVRRAMPPRRRLGERRRRTPHHRAWEQWSCDSLPLSSHSTRTPRVLSVLAVAVCCALVCRGSAAAKSEA